MNTNTTSPVLLEWSAPERLPIERGRVWFAILGLLVICGAVWSILTAAWTLTIVIILGSALYFQHLRLHIVERTVRIRQNGFSVGDACTPWEHCTGFWIYQHGNEYLLHIEKSRGWDREVILVIRNVDARLLAEVISTYVPYQATRREKLLDSIIRICKL